MKCKTPLLSKEHYQDLVGVGTPGVGEYKEDSFVEDGPKYTQHKEPWFWIPPKATKNCAHAYITPLMFIRKGTGLSCDTRFKYEQENWQRSQQSPGPGKYNQFTAFWKLRVLEWGFGNNIKFNNLTYFKEL